MRLGRGKSDGLPQPIDADAPSVALLLAMVERTAPTLKGLENGY